MWLLLRQNQGTLSTPVISHVTTGGQCVAACDNHTAFPPSNLLQTVFLGTCFISLEHFSEDYLISFYSSSLWNLMKTPYK